MSCRQVNYANRRKAELLAELGSQCWACGATHDLEIDHPAGRDWKPRQKSFSARIALYWREHKQNLLRILCSDCNASNRYNGVTLPHPGTALEAVAEDPGCPF